MDVVDFETQAPLYISLCSFKHDSDLSGEKSTNLIESRCFDALVTDTGRYSVNERNADFFIRFLIDFLNAQRQHHLHPRYKSCRLLYLQNQSFILYIHIFKKSFTVNRLYMM